MRLEQLLDLVLVPVLWACLGGFILWRHLRRCEPCRRRFLGVGICPACGDTGPAGDPCRNRCRRGGARGLPS